MSDSAKVAAPESKAQAIAEGRKTCVGKPCIHHPETREKWVSNGVCIKCSRRGIAQYRQQNKATLAQKRKEWDRDNPVRAMLQRARRRAKDVGLEFDLNPEDVSIPERCPILGIDLNRFGSNQDNAPSLDRIENDKGYVRGNVVVISFRANRIKGNATVEKLRKVVEFYEQYERKSDRGQCFVGWNPLDHASTDLSALHPR